MGERGLEISESLIELALSMSRSRRGHLKLRGPDKWRKWCILVAIFCSLGLMLAHRNLLEVRPMQVAKQANGNLLNGSQVVEARKRLPQVIIIGARKSGTRALLRFIQLNGAIKAARSEVHFFDRPANFRKGLGWYRDQMPTSSTGQLTIEKSPAYFVSRQVPERIKAMNSSIKLVLVLREPVTRLISDFSQLIANRFESEDVEDEDHFDVKGELQANERKLDAKATDQAWRAAQEEFERFVLRPDGGVDEQRPAVRLGMYASHLERWLALFGRHQLHLVDGEQLIKRPHEELRRLELFLGLPATIREQDFVFDHRKGFFCLAPNNGSKHLLFGAGKRSQDSSGGQAKPICLSKSKGRRHVQVDARLIEQLEEFYAPYNEYLFSLTGINFNKQK